MARASIYRALEVLSDLGLLVRVDVGHGAARYERAYDHDEEHHHHHLVCDTCGLLIPFDDEHLELVIDGLSERLGFETKGHEVTLRGTCEECRLGFRISRGRIGRCKSTRRGSTAWERRSSPR